MHRGRCTPIFFGAGTPAQVSLPSIAGQVYATNVPQARLLNAATVQKKNAWCPNPAWRQVRAKTGVLARKRRIFAVWSPRWARALCLRKLQVVSPRRYAGTHHGYESNWYPPLSPLPLRSHKIQRSGSGRRNQWNTGDGNTARPAGRDSKREAEPIRPAPTICSIVSSRADHLKFPQTWCPRPTRRPISKYPALTC